MDTHLPQPAPPSLFPRGGPTPDFWWRQALHPLRTPDLEKNEEGKQLLIHNNRPIVEKSMSKEHQFIKMLLDELGRTWTNLDELGRTLDELGRTWTNLDELR